MSVVLFVFFFVKSSNFFSLTVFLETENANIVRGEKKKQKNHATTLFAFHASCFPVYEVNIKFGGTKTISQPKR